MDVRSVGERSMEQLGSGETIPQPSLQFPVVPESPLPWRQPPEECAKQRAHERLVEMGMHRPAGANSERLRRWLRCRSAATSVVKGIGRGRSDHPDGADISSAVTDPILSSRPGQSMDLGSFSLPRSRSAERRTLSESVGLMVPCLALRREFAESDSDVVATEPEGVAHGNPDIRLSHLIGHVIQIAVRIRKLVVCGRMNDAFFY